MESDGVVTVDNYRQHGDYTVDQPTVLRRWLMEQEFFSLILLISNYMCGVYELLVLWILDRKSCFPLVKHMSYLSRITEWTD